MICTCLLYTSLAVLARHEAAAGERAFVGVAAVALQEELLVLTTALAEMCIRDSVNS